MHPLLLASSSPYRRELLERLGLPFECSSPDIDETRQPDEPAERLVRRLAAEKACALAHLHPNRLIIGSDQVATLGDTVLGKPGSHQQATRQLLAASGRSVRFLTGLALLDSASGQLQVDCIPFIVHFRELSTQQIERYLQRDKPYDCAGSFKAEGLGVTLFRATEGSDATSLIGLPLIRLTDMLIAAGIELP
ncbi:Maf family protein [Pseudomonas oligotrophica]|uniref:Maf family protein n=1 Tax=Pseudomonas oligotrophica TaxID=2912055 RepID=UPI001EFF62C2|nr:nucleoside triphosphate pyrophosphatase [Pseudomonas oligotrophica]MCF7202291.1 Maf family nucleotide pyrophosphatase [Pseudomonas oligotrophica]